MKTENAHTIGNTFTHYLQMSQDLENYIKHKIERLTASKKEEFISALMRQDQLTISKIQKRIKSAEEQKRILLQQYRADQFDEAVKIIDKMAVFDPSQEMRESSQAGFPPQS